MTDITVLDTDLTTTVYIIDTVEALIWTDRYCGCGEFEITTTASATIAYYLTKGRYLCQRNSDHAMIIEDLFLRSNSEAGNTIIIKGRSAESILNRRVLFAQTILTGNVHNAIKQLVNANAISSSIPERNIPELIFEDSTDPAVTSLVFAQDAQLKGGEVLYDVLTNICSASGLGYILSLREDGKLVFKLYAGKDHSYDQLTNPYVVFSPDFDNLLTSDYSESNRLLKTVSLVGGEGEGTDRKFVVVEGENPGSGLSRREVFTDASGISKTTDTGTLTDEEYTLQLAQKGLEDLATNYIEEKKFEGELDPERTFIYGKDFSMGDIVQVANEYGHEGKSRVTELIYSEDQNGIKLYPTFSTIE